METESEELLRIVIHYFYHKIKDYLNNGQVNNSIQLFTPGVTSGSFIDYGTIIQ